MDPVNDALGAYERALEKTDFKGKNDRGRLFNPTIEEMKDHQRERPGKRYSDDVDDEKDDDIYDRELWSSLQIKAFRFTLISHFIKIFES